MRPDRPEARAVPEPAPGATDRRDTETATTLVTVIVPALNEERSLPTCLGSILSQDAPDLEVLIVDGGSRDGTKDVVRAYAERDPRVRLLEVRGSIPEALNVALGAARGRWLVRVDAHSTIPQGYVRRAVELLRSGAWGGVGGRKDGVATTPAGRAIAATLASRFGVGGSTYHFGTAAGPVDHVPFGAYPVELLRDMGGWDERLEANEDYELDYRLRLGGHQLLFDPSLRIDWETRGSIGEFFRQYRRYGRGKADVARLHPASLSPRHLAAPALVASWALALAVAIPWPLLAALIAAPYPLALAVASVATARRVRGLGTKLRIPAAFAAMHVGWGIGFWEGLIRRRRLR